MQLRHLLIPALALANIITAATYHQINFTHAPLGAITSFGGLNYTGWLVTNSTAQNGLLGASPPKYLYASAFAASITSPQIALYLQSFYMGCTNYIPGDFSSRIPQPCQVEIVAWAPDFLWQISRYELSYEVPANLSEANPQWMTKFKGPFGGTTLWFLVNGGYTGMNLFLDNLNYSYA